MKLLILNKPIIAAGCGGVKKILIPNETGIVTNFSKEEIKQAMKEIMQNSQIKLKLKDERRKLNFHEHNMKMYEQVERVFS